MSKKILKIFQITLIMAILFSPVSPVLHAYVSSVATDNATNITNVSATLNGVITVNNIPVNIWFEYGTDSRLNNSSTKNINASRLDYYEYNSKIKADIAGLYPNTKYYFRAVAQDSSDTTRGTIRSFTTNNYYDNSRNVNNNYTANPVNNYINTSLSAITQPANNINSTSAELSSLVYNTPNYVANTWFEWGTTANFGNITAVVTTGSLPSVKHVNKMTGLSPGTTYYFRAVAENSLWRNIGATLSFTTSGTQSSTYTNTSSVTSTDTIIKTDNTTTQSSQGANVVGSDTIFPVSLLGWLLLLILILVLILLGKHVHRSFSNK